MKQTAKDPSSLRRLARRFMWKHPNLHRILLGRRIPGGVAAIRQDFDCWLDGYPRSGNTFAAHALSLCLPEGTRVRTHFHQPPLIISAIRSGKPGIFIIREPRECAISWSLFTGKPLGELLDYYIDFHKVLLPYRDRMLVASFAQATNNFQVILDEFSSRFGVPCKPFDHTAEVERKIFSQMENEQRRKRNGEVNEMTIWRPSARRAPLQSQLAEEIERSSELQRKLEQTDALYRQFVPTASRLPQSGRKTIAESGQRLLIVVPTLGRSPYLNETIASIRTVKLPKEVIIACPEPEISELSLRYPDFSVVRDAGREGGLYGAINAALAAAREPWDWFTYINDDDLLTPAFETMARTHCQPENRGTVAYGDIDMIDDAGKSLGRMTVEKSPSRLGVLLQCGISPVGQQGMLFSALVVSKLAGYRPAFRVCGDLDFWARAHAGGCRFCYYGQTVGRFRVQAGQLSGDTGLTRREMEKIVKEHYPNPASSVKKMFARVCYRLSNVPRYIERRRAMGGWLTGEQVLESGGSAASQEVCK